MNGPVVGVKGLEPADILAWLWSKSCPLGSRERATLSAIVAHMRPRRLFSYPAIPTIADASGQSARTVKRSIAELRQRALPWLRIDEQEGETYVFSVVANPGDIVPGSAPFAANVANDKLTPPAVLLSDTRANLTPHPCQIDTPTRAKLSPEDNKPYPYITSSSSSSGAGAGGDVISLEAGNSPAVAAYEAKLEGGIDLARHFARLMSSVGKRIGDATASLVAQSVRSDIVDPAAARDYLSLRVAELSVDESMTARTMVSYIMQDAKTWRVPERPETPKTASVRPPRRKARLASSELAVGFNPYSVEDGWGASGQGAADKAAQEASRGVTSEVWGKVVDAVAAEVSIEAISMARSLTADPDGATLVVRPRRDGLEFELVYTADKIGDIVARKAGRLGFDAVRFECDMSDPIVITNPPQLEMVL